jgi:Family of unknown function (DUF5335)
MPGIKISPDVWTTFLEDFTKRHVGWWVAIETHDVETGETVTSHMARLRSIELDLEDQTNPRINVTVFYDTKEIKHILFRPSQVTLHLSEKDDEDYLRVRSVNTKTAVRLLGEPAARPFQDFQKRKA